MTPRPGIPPGKLETLTPSGECTRRRGAFPIGNSSASLYPWAIAATASSILIRPLISSGPSIKIALRFGRSTAFEFYPEFIFGLKSDGIANVEVEDGSLTINSKGSGWFTIVNDPWRPTPSDGGHLGPNPGKFNRSIIDKRLDVGVFQTNSFEEDQYLK